VKTINKIKKLKKHYTFLKKLLKKAGIDSDYNVVKFIRNHVFYKKQIDSSDNKLNYKWACDDLNFYLINKRWEDSGGDLNKLKAEITQTRGDDVITPLYNKGFIASGQNNLKNRGVSINKYSDKFIKEFLNILSKSFPKKYI